MIEPLETLKKHTKKSDTVILGISGGPDSVYLLEQCINLIEEHPLNLIVAHVNHKLRGKESNEDAAFVEKLAKKFNLPFELKNLNKILKKGSGNIEEICRKHRYAFFEKVRKKYNAKWILTAHHFNDNIETVLFNLVRGSFIGGLKGIEQISKKRHLLRPLLNLKKSDILDYLKKNKIDYREDPTNKDTTLSRNLLRHEVIPNLRKINAGFEQTFSMNLKTIDELENYLNTQTRKWLSTNRNGNHVQLGNFQKLDPVMQKNTLAFIYKELYGSINKFNQNHLGQILKIIHKGHANKKKEFGDDYFIKISNTKNGKNKVIEITSKA